MPPSTPRLSTAQEQVLRATLDAVHRMLRETERGGPLHQASPRHASALNRWGKSLRKALEALLALTDAP